MRVQGVKGAERGQLLGNQGWQLLRVEFDITGLDQEVELICELRARAGTAWFGVDSLRLVSLAGQ